MPPWFAAVGGFLGILIILGLGGGPVLGPILLIVLVGVFYFIPAIIACERGTGHFGVIFFINLVFGWTVLGWIAALIWAIVEKPLDLKA